MKGFLQRELKQMGYRMYSNHLNSFITFLTSLRCLLALYHKTFEAVGYRPLSLDARV